MALSDVRTYAALRRKTAYIAAWWLADSQIGHLPVLLALGSLVPIEEAAHPLGEPTGTLQPKDESVIMGYYTLQKCRSPTLPLSVNLKERKHQWQEMME